jgi:hypothetical protein
MLLNHTCHPCHGYPHHFVTADWPGAWSEEMRRAYGPEVVPLVLNGCCGNIHHCNHLDPHQVDEYGRMGQLLAETTHGVLKGMSFQADIALDYRTARFPIPFRCPSEEEIAAARALLERHPAPPWRDEGRTQVEWDWFFAVSLLDLLDRREREGAYQCEVQVLRIGDTALVGLPGEPFVEGQLRLKLASPTYPTYVAHHCNSPLSYVPTAQAFGRGGYEVASCNSAKLVPEALDLIVDAALALLREMFPGG